MPAGDDEYENLPTDVLTAPAPCSLRPPILTRQQELPFAELSWENFERLCMRLAGLDGTPEHWQRYGTAGQAQHGIDIYARVGGARSYYAYQCKRYAQLQPSQLRNAVSAFLKDKWKAKCSRFVFCVTVTLEPTGLADEVETQTDRLKAEGIDFVPWGAVQLAEKLKDHPSIVDDFFGREWVKAFCGDQVAASLSSRLDGVRLAHLRAQLGNFYRRIFRQHDPWFPGGADVVAVAPTLEDRYVSPRIRVTDTWVLPDVNGVAQASAAEALDDSRWDDWTPEPAISDSGGELDSLDRVMLLDDWLDSSPRLLIIGPPGAGKSSLLRFVALDALSDEPRLLKVARSRPGCIPMWVPFGFWTELLRLRGTEQCSLRSCLQSWFASHDASDLYLLVEPALSDRRLLLLVDGVDEWRSPDLAGLATQRLIEFIERDATPMVCSSRPYGVDRATELDPTISTGVLDDLGPDDQRTLAATLFRYWLSIGKPDAEIATEKATEFVGEVNIRPDLATLCRSPMLLSLLARSWIHSGVLADNVYEAYSSLVDHLHTLHPRLRANAASVKSLIPTLSSGERLSHVCFLASHMQESGVYEAERAWLRAMLVDHIVLKGFDATESRAIADAVLGQASDAPALLVNTSTSHIAFLHRGLLEHLAARWIVAQGSAYQLETIRRHVDDPRWGEVILQVIQGARLDERSALVEAVRIAFQSDMSSSAPLSILGSVAFGSFGIGPKLARQLATECLDYAEHGSSSRARVQVTRAAVLGLRSSRVAEVVGRRLSTWFPSGGSFRSSVYSALGALQPSEHLKIAMIRALNDDDSLDQKTAAIALARAFGKDETTRDWLVQRVSKPARPSVQAACLYALSLGWSQSPVVLDLGNRAIKSESATIRLAGLTIRASFGMHDSQDADALLDMIVKNNADLESGWGDVVDELLAGHWADNEQLRTLVRKGIDGSANDFLFGERAWKLARAVLVDDKALIGRIIACLEDPKPFILHSEHFWRATAKHSQRAQVRSAVDEWAWRQSDFDNHVYAAACAFSTDGMKCLALRHARERRALYFWPMHALVNAWSLDDTEVRDLALELSTGSLTDRSYVAPFLWELYGEDTAKRQLMQLLADPQCTRRDFVVRAIVDHASSFSLPEVVDAFLSGEKSPELRWLNGFHRLLSLGIEHPVLLELVNQAAERRGDMLAPILTGYGDHPKYHVALVQAAVPGSALLRRTLVEAVERMPSDVASTESLRGWVTERDGVTRATAALTYARRVGRTDTGLLNELLAEATCYGQTWEQRREAAFCGLVELRELEQLRDRKETIGEPRPIRIPLLRARSKVSPVATRVLAEHWDYVCNTFPDELKERLSPDAPAPVDALETLVSIADWVPADTVLARHMVNLLEAGGSPPPVALLGFMSRLMPSSQLLLQQCLRVLLGGAKAKTHNMLLQAQAADIVARQFATDDVLKELLDASGDSFPPPGVLIAVCKGWPDHAWLTTTYDRAIRENAVSSELGIFELRCARAPAESIEDVLRELVASREPWNLQVRQTLLPSLIRRIQQDADVAERLRDMITAADLGLSLQVAAARMNTAALGPSSIVRSWVSKRMVEASSSALWPVAFDVVTGRERCLQDLVWDLTGCTS